MSSHFPEGTLADAGTITVLVDDELKGVVEDLANDNKIDIGECLRKLLSIGHAARHLPHVDHIVLSIEPPLKSLTARGVPKGLVTREAARTYADTLWVAIGVHEVRAKRARLTDEPLPTRFELLFMDFLDTLPVRNGGQP